MYRYVRKIFVVKCVTITLFFSLLVQRFDGKAWFLLFCYPLKLYKILYSAGTIFFIAQSSLEDWAITSESLPTRERAITLQMYNVVYSTLYFYFILC